MKIEVNNILTWMSFGQTMKCVIFYLNDDSNKNSILFDVMLTFENEIHLNVGRKSEN